MIRREALNVEMGIGQSIYQVVNSFTFQQFIDELFLNRKICLHPSPIPDSLLIVLKRSMVLIVMASHSRNSMKQACKAIYDADFLRIQPSSINRVIVIYDFMRDGVIAKPRGITSGKSVRQ